MIGHIVAGERCARQAIVLALDTVPLVVLSDATCQALSHECGSAARATAWLWKQANRARKPIGLHHDGRTEFYAPLGWSRQRLAGYVAAHHDELEAAFGQVDRVEIGESR
jgi:hypothetical protein